MKKVLYRSLIVLIIFIIGASIGYQIGYKRKPLPVLGPKDFNAELVDESVQIKESPHTIGNFALINQEGKLITQEDFKGKIYVADFFFTTCPGICPVMTTNLSRIFIEFKGDQEVKLISHSVTPEEDSVPVLKAYAEKYHANSDQWHFVTGDKKQIYSLARKHYFAASSKGDGGKEDFIHSQNFILVDHLGRIRGAYDGTSFDEVDQLIKDIEFLKSEIE